MEKKLEYSGSLTREQFLFYETRVVARLLADGLAREEILKAVKQDNLFQFPTERMVASICNTCLRRLEGLNSMELVQALAEGAQEDAKLINLYSMMQHVLSSPSGTERPDRSVE